MKKRVTLVVNSAYLCYPFKRLSLKRLAVKSEEANSSLLWYSNHEEFVIRCDHYVADVMTSISLAIISKLNRSHFRLVLDVESEVSATRCDDESFVLLNIV